MIVKTKAPLRVSFGGGGTDVEPYASDYGGYILSAAINLYSRATYGIEHTPQNDMERLLAKIMGRAVRITTDVHPASGLGGSSTCLVAGLKAIYPELGPEQVARLAFYLERNAMNVPGGIQDQYCAAYGGMLFMTVEGDKTYIERMDCADNLSKLLVLVYACGRKVPGEDIIADQNARYNLRALHQQKQIAIAMKESLLNQNLVDFGKLLGDSWTVKCEMSDKVTCEEIDSLYQYGLSHGATGGCIMGAGAGGYMLFMEHPDTEGELRQALIERGTEYLNVIFDNEGVQVLTKGAEI